MGAMALWGGYQAFKKVKSKIKGYRESKQEKKDNKKAGVSIELKKFNSETGKMDTETEMIAKPGTSGAAMNADDIALEQKKRQKKLDPENTRLKNEYQEKEKGAKEKRSGIEDVEDAEEFFANNGSSPDGWEDVRSQDEKDSGVDFKGKIMTNVDADKYRKKKERLAKQPKPDEGNESYMLKFGEFIAEDIMKDLKKASKSKKDTEITLDDGADISIDPMTADIFVKYIEGLSSLEKNKTIKQIQRTERGFMKVLGKAHEG